MIILFMLFLSIVISMLTLCGSRKKRNTTPSSRPVSVAISQSQRRPTPSGLSFSPSGVTQQPTVYTTKDVASKSVFYCSEDHCMDLSWIPKDYNPFNIDNKHKRYTKEEVQIEFIKNMPKCQKCGLGDLDEKGVVKPINCCISHATATRGKKAYCLDSRPFGDSMSDTQSWV